MEEREILILILFHNQTSVIINRILSYKGPAISTQKQPEGVLQFPLHGLHVRVLNCNKIHQIKVEVNEVNSQDRIQ